MTKEQEAQQAQTIAEIKHNQGLRTELCNFNGAYVDCEKLLEIVDSQAQKIEQQDADIANLLNKLANWPATYERQEQKIAEQAKEIDRLKKLDEIAENARIDRSLTEYYRKSL